MQCTANTNFIVYCLIRPGHEAKIINFMIIHFKVHCYEYFEIFSQLIKNDVMPIGQKLW